MLGEDEIDWTEVLADARFDEPSLIMLRQTLRMKRGIARVPSWAPDLVSRIRSRWRDDMLGDGSVDRPTKPILLTALQWVQRGEYASRSDRAKAIIAIADMPFDDGLRALDQLLGSD